MNCRAAGWLVALTILLAGLPALANETDQFLLPADREFADVGPFLNYVTFEAVRRGADEVNAKIEAARKIKDEQDRLRRIEALQQPRVLADAVRFQFPPGFFDMMDLESALRSSRAKKLYPEQVVAHRPIDWVYMGAHLPIDPRNLVLLFQSSTINVYGVYLGVDKFGHFHDLGHIYYKDYLAERRKGRSDEEAVRTIVHRFSRGPISEDAVIGRFATGVRSNADLASNYLGFKFYRNLTEPIMLGDRELPPMLVLRYGKWRLNDHVDAYSDFLRPFISNHFNEALNPSIYELGMRNNIRERLEKEREIVLQAYADEYGQPRPREYFEDLAQELATCYGEDYGHLGWHEGTLSIANTCFPEEEEQETMVRR